jgi:hypothetical protein
MDDETTYIGKKEVWGGEKPFGLSRAERRQHLYIIGKTGTGKSTLLRNLLCQDICRGEGVGLIDPHGDLAEEILDSIPSWRTDDVVYFNPADIDFPIGLNLVRSVTGKKYLEASAVVGAFKHIWRDSWGPRLEYILYATVSALLECENVSLLGVPRMLSEPRFRAWVLRQVTDPMVSLFWRTEFEGFDKRFLAETIAPIQNKVGQLLMAAPLRNILGQVRTRFDARFIMDNRRIFIANLSKGRLGEDKANLFGSLLVSRFQTAALERSNLGEDNRPDFYLSIDEFHNFSTDSFASILSEARKYHLNLTLAHQYSSQMTKEVRSAVFGNVGSIIAFRVGSDDANVLAAEMGSEYSAEHFTELGNFEARVRHVGAREPAFVKMIPPIPCSFGRSRTIIARSRERFGTPRRKIETKIRRWLKG